MESESRRVLVVENEPHIRRVIKTVLVSKGYEVWDARTGHDALDLIRSEKLDLVLLEINLPDMNGVEVCREIRADFFMVVIVLTDRSSEKDKIAAFDAGADDYVTKPFAASELLARIRAHLRRRKQVPQTDVFACDDFVVDFADRHLTRQGKKIHLSPKQRQLLRCLVSDRGKPLSHRTLLRAVWGPDYGEETTLLHAQIVQLRKKIEPDPSHPRYIVTIPWVGYRFEGQGATRSSGKLRPPIVHVQGRWPQRMTYC
jgi:two-component system, OmpR family, KDP operon response regulator KdpE